MRVSEAGPTGVIRFDDYQIVRVLNTVSMTAFGCGAVWLLSGCRGDLPMSAPEPS